MFLARRDFMRSATQQDIFNLLGNTFCPILRLKYLPGSGGHYDKEGIPADYCMKCFIEAGVLKIALSGSTKRNFLRQFSKSPGPDVLPLNSQPAILIF